MVSRRIFLASMIAALVCILALFSNQKSADVMLGSDISARSVFAAPVTIHKLYLPLVLKNAVSTSALWRFGVAKVQRPFSDYQPQDISDMRIGWTIDFSLYYHPSQTYGIEYVPVVRVKQTKLVNGVPSGAWCWNCAYVSPPTYTLQIDLGALQSNAAAHRGLTWIIGNEIERRDWDNGNGTSGGQDEITPEVYVRAYHDAYAAIKAGDPSAKVAIGGMIESTPLRLKYLDQVWSAYTNTFHITMPVDVWNVHGFVLQEVRGQFGADIPAGLTETVGMQYSIIDNKNFSLARTNIIALRTWMQQHGQQNKPLIISEYSVNYPDSICDPTGYYCFPGTFSPTQVRDSMMYPSFTYFLTTGISSTIGFPQDGYRLVQRWNWYSFDDDSTSGGIQNYNGNLFYSGLYANPQGVAPLGSYWKTYVQPLAPSPNPPY